MSKDADIPGNEGGIGRPPDFDAALKIATSEVSPDRLPWAVWGSLVWRSSSPLMHPSAAGIKCDYAVLIRLRRNDEPSFSTLRSGRFLGDSELVIRGSQIVREFGLPAREPVGAAHTELIENESGRLGSIVMAIADCADSFTAYRVAQTVFNMIAVAAGVQCSIPLRWASMLITRQGTSDLDPVRHDVVSAVGYPDALADLTFNRPKALARLVSNYVEGLRSNSPFYAFLCFFALTEFMTTTLQGRLRNYTKIRAIEYVDLKGMLTQDDVGKAAPQFAGVTYANLLDATREMRNAVAHFLIEPSPRPFNVAAEDKVSFARDALKVACRDLLRSAETNYYRFEAAGASSEELLRVFEGT